MVDVPDDVDPVGFAFHALITAVAVGFWYDPDEVGTFSTGRNGFDYTDWFLGFCCHGGCGDLRSNGVYRAR